jgi:hypothetical protein
MKHRNIIKNATDTASGSDCGPAYLQDDGIQLFASMLLLAQCASFIGTQISNIDAVIAELMSTLRHPPVVIDVLNDLNQPAESDDRAWHLGMHQARARPLPLERLVSARGGRYKVRQPAVRGAPAVRAQGRSASRPCRFRCYQPAVCNLRRKRDYSRPCSAF